MSGTLATNAERVLDLGCGRDKLLGAVGMDRNAASHADIIHDLDCRPWPLPDSSFDRVRAQDILEHVADFVGVMEEVHRVCRDRATVHVRMPFMSSLNFANDPTHRRAGTSSTFDYFDPERPLGKYAYSMARFHLAEFRYGRVYHGKIGRLMRPLDRLFIIPWCEKNVKVYEHYLAYLWPMHDIMYVLEVVKSAPPPPPQPL